MTTNSSYHHPGKEDIIISMQNGDKKRLDVEGFAQVKEGGQPFSRISGENRKQRWLVWLVEADRKLGANAVEKTLRMTKIQQVWELPANL
jgi:hypothetical protein